MKRQGIAEALRDAIAEEMERDSRVFCLGEDSGVPGGWGGAFTVTLGLEKKFPDRTVNVGIAEKNMVGVGAGLANGGKIPFVSAASCFLTARAMEQIKADIAYSNVNVKLVGQSVMSTLPGSRS